MKKKFLVSCLLIFLLMFCVACNGNVNKYKWNDAYMLRYKDLDIDRAFVVTLSEPDKDVSDCIKELKVKFEKDSVFIKIEYWDGDREEKEIYRRFISYVDYL